MGELRGSTTPSASLRHGHTSPRTTSRHLKVACHQPEWSTLIGRDCPYLAFIGRELYRTEISLQCSTMNCPCRSSPLCCIAGARSRSQRLRSTVDDLLNTEYNNLHQNWTDTNKAFQHRISSTQSAHTNLRSHLSRTMQEIFEQEKHMKQLEGAIRSMVI